MDDQTALVFTVQMVALCGVAASLLVYLICRIKSRHLPGRDGGLAVLVTSCDTVLGLEAALHLADEGFRVFAGVRETDSAVSQILASKGGMRVTVLPLDVTREDLLHEAVDIIRKHLPAGEDGLWAVINTAGVCCKGRLDMQEGTHWDLMLKYNVVGTLKTARTFLPLLKNKKGRLINIGAQQSACDRGNGLVAYTASRFAVEGASSVLRQEMAPHGVRIITLQPQGDSASDNMFKAPSVKSWNAMATEGNSTVLEMAHYETVLPLHVLQTLVEALLAKTSREAYLMRPANKCGQIADGFVQRVMYPQSGKPLV